jgi:hypothetical protein
MCAFATLVCVHVTVASLHSRCYASRVSTRNTAVQAYTSPLMAELRRQGRSIVWLATQMHTSRFTVWRIETGRQEPPADWYERAATLLNAPAVDLRPAKPRRLKTIVVEVAA